MAERSREEQLRAAWAGVRHIALRSASMIPHYQFRVGAEVVNCDIEIVGNEYRVTCEGLTLEEPGVGVGSTQREQARRLGLAER